MLGAVQRGHYVLKSGMHSSDFFDIPRIARRPLDATHFAHDLAARFSDTTADTIVGVATGGSILGFLVAHRLEYLLGRPVSFVDTTKNARGELAFARADLELITEKRTLIIDDLVTTGKTVAQVIDLIDHYGGKNIGVGSIVRRGRHPLQFNPSRYRRLCVIENCSEYPEDNCPLCDQGVGINTTYGHGQAFLESKSSAL